MWNSETNTYELDTSEAKLQRVLGAYNKRTGSNYTLDEITNASLQGRGSGIHAIFYTFLQSLTFVESGILDMEAKLIRFIIDSQARINRPLQMKDNLKDKMLQDGLDVVLLDGQDPKIAKEDLNSGLWIITKGVIPVDKREAFANNLKFLVAGIEMNGDKTITTTLDNGMPQTYRYTEALKLEDFKVKINYQLQRDLELQATIDARLKAEFLEAFTKYYKIGYDFSIKQLETMLYPLFPEVSYLEIRHSLDNVNYLLGTYQVPYDKYLELSISDIGTEEIQ